MVLTELLLDAQKMKGSCQGSLALVGESSSLWLWIRGVSVLSGSEGSVSSVAVSWGLLTPTPGCLCLFFLGPPPIHIQTSNFSWSLVVHSDVQLCHQLETHSKTSILSGLWYLSSQMTPPPHAVKGTSLTAISHQSSLWVLPTCTAFIFMLTCNWAQ